MKPKAPLETPLRLPLFYYSREWPGDVGLSGDDVAALDAAGCLDAWGRPDTDKLRDMLLRAGVPPDRLAGMTWPDILAAARSQGIPDLSGWLTVSEAEKRTSINGGVISRACNNRQLRHVGVKQSRRIDPAALLEWKYVRDQRPERRESDRIVENKCRQAGV